MHYKTKKTLHHKRLKMNLLSGTILWFRKINLEIIFNGEKNLTTFFTV